ncbi:TAXI family TRAP transporter solute-binding subunit [Neoroseomonas oryzicola]|uniref:TAXI family TRAP transporter solute-binding subunit n=1 Tax=Neoroseomonas oryzicola TaxID=535904 RepID=A0A9X9WQ19_9PROT|nr:TAXI family TRAP transporter solute-binding subunit [Neoroseomonas oryzicola]MBR0662429.1 TAXI family TRAP transporter solute-binding subunit [Neoroseomonas oryzicola]NKE19348.1 TAXI family TRAP transporter solute-binding subunit [Neoroseomonas oryzicola]
MLRRIVLLFGLLLSAPALAMPDAATLRGMVEARIAEAAGPGLLEVIEFRPMGQAPDPAGGARIAYFAARLRLARDHEFGAWDGRNLQALAAALGAGPRAIGGANREGNRAGDVLRVNGALRMREEAGRWVPLAATAADTPLSAFEGQGAQAARLLSAIGTALTAGQQAAGGRMTPVIEQELAQAWRNIEARQARLRHGLPVAGGAAGSEYARLAEAMARLPAASGLGQAVALPSAGSVENIRLLADGTALVGIVQADVARRAILGGAPEWDLPAAPGLRALAALYPEVVHVGVPAASSLRRMEDLRGKPVGVGAIGSGTRVTAEEVLIAHGLDAATTPRVALAPEEVAAALASGRIAAAIGVSLAPAQAVLRIADAVPMRFLPLDDTAIARLTGAEGPLMRATIPAGTYPGQAGPVATVATPAALLAAEALTPAEVTALLGRLFEGQGLAATGGPAALMIRRETARGPLPLPFHPAAQRFYGNSGE